jgi:purine nucleosidase
MGCDRQIGRAWGQIDARPSPASEAIIAAAKNIPNGEYLHILTLGALSNIATALIQSPEIIPKIKLYSLGAKYNHTTKVWDKSEFNIRNDLNAFDYLLNLPSLDFTILPLETAYPLQFQRDDTYASLNDTIEVEKILADRWREHNPQDKTRIMWDLALVEAYLNPNLVKKKVTQTPQENKKRKINVYTKIEEVELAHDFWNTLKK